MDLIEIRKKAKEKKEAEEKAAREAAAAAAASAEAGAQEEAPEGPAKAGTGEVAAPKKKRARKAVKPPKPEDEQAAQEAPQPVAEEHEPEPEPALPDEEWPAEPDEQWLDEAMKAEAAKAEAEVQPAPAAPAAPSAPPVSSGPPAPSVPPVPPEPETKAGEEEEPGEQGEEVKEEDIIVEYLAFMLAGEEYAVKVEAVKEIIRLQQITKVPRAEGFVEGIISLRGVIIPVYDIKKRLGLESNEERQRSVRIVIISGDGSLQGIIVDKVTGVARLRAGAIEPPPAVIGGVEGEYLEGVGRMGERLLILFNTERVLSLDSGTDR